MTTIALIFATSVATAAEAPDSLAAGHAATGYTSLLVPDSLAREFRKVMEGKSKIVSTIDTVDFSERVLLANGDTVPMYLKDRNLGRFDRGLYNHLFIPKGEWVFGLTASYGEFSSQDLELLSFLTDLDLNGHAFSINPSIAYAIGNNMTVGVRFGYSSTKGGLGHFNLDIDEDMKFNISDVGYSNESYTAAVTFRQYIGLSRRGKFGVFNDIELGFSSSHGTFNRIYDEKPKETFTTGMEARLSFSPGICVRIMKNVSFNVSFAVVGFYLHKENQRVDGEPVGTRFSSGANFKFNVFNINFGLGVHI